MRSATAPLYLIGRQVPCPPTQALVFAEGLEADEVNE